jgi:hypothetical protein
MNNRLMRGLVDRRNAQSLLSRGSRPRLAKRQCLYNLTSLISTLYDAPQMNLHRTFPFFKDSSRLINILLGKRRSFMFCSITGPSPTVSLSASTEPRGRGVMNTPIDQLTAQGLDLQFGTNVVGHYLLTKLLLPSLIAGAQSSPDGKVRVVNQSSSAQMFVDTIDFLTLTDVAARKKLGSAKLYMQSKFVGFLSVSRI